VGSCENGKEFTSILFNVAATFKKKQYPSNQAVAALCPRKKPSELKLQKIFVFPSTLYAVTKGL
jgi:hypothetical protein